jgi:hypothetical protein
LGRWDYSIEQGHAEWCPRQLCRFIKQCKLVR